jgi:hypothetical protein
MEHHGAVADHGAVLDLASLEMDDVPDDAVIADDRGVGRGGVQDGVVLDAGSSADRDVPVVAAQHGTRPDRRLSADTHIADDHRVRMDVGARIDRGLGAGKGVDRHAATIPLRPMSRRIDIELTSSQSDGSWTWRAAGAREPKGTVSADVLPADAAVGSTLRVEVEQGLDGIEVLSVVGGRQRTDDSGRLELLASDSKFDPVIETRAKRARGERRGDDRPRRRDGGGQRDRRGGRRDGDNAGGEGREGRRSGQRRGPRFTPPPEVPQRPKPKRLRPGRTHRAEVLGSIAEDRRPIAEVALQGMAAVRKRLREENKRISESGGTPMPEDSVLKMAEEMLPRLRVAEWRDRADAALRQLENLDLRDLRSVVAAADDPIVTRDTTTRELADQLRVALREKQEQELQLWFGDVDAALAVGRVVRALRLSSQPPKAGVVFPPAIATRLVDSTNATLTPLESAERWSAILEAAAFSPIRSLIKPMGRPDVVADDLLATITRLAPAIPQVAEMFGVEVPAGAQMPKPLRPTRPGRPGQAKQDRGKGSPRDRRETKGADRKRESAQNDAGSSDGGRVDAEAAEHVSKPIEQGEVKETVAEETVAEQAAVEQAVVDEAVVEETVVEKAAAEEASVDEVVADEVTSDAAETNDTPSDTDEVTSADSPEGSTEDSNDEAVEDSSDEKAAEPSDEDELTDS